MPHRQDDLAVLGHFAGDQTSQLSLGPPFLEEGLADDYNAKPRAGQAAIDRLAEAVADLKTEFVVPDIKVGVAKRPCEWADQFVLVLASVANKDIMLHRLSLARNPSVPQLAPLKSPIASIALCSGFGPVAQRFPTFGISDRQHPLAGRPHVAAEHVRRPLFRPRPTGRRSIDDHGRQARVKDCASDDAHPPRLN